MPVSRRRALKCLSVGLLLSSPLLFRVAMADTPCRPLKGEDGQARSVCKAVEFNRDYADDVFLGAHLRPVLDTIVKRLVRLKRYVGYANFSLLSFDEALRYARHYPRIGAFEAVETELLEGLFFADAAEYGFAGEKVLSRLTDDVKRRRYVKVAGSGHYLYEGPSLALFRRLQGELGDALILSSGIRGIIKQMHLFLAKAQRCGGNLSRAARSLAPPGHSYHGIGDFDVGERGLGALNFSERFADTEVYQRLSRLDYLHIRYHRGNADGVRYEPWHIRVDGI